MHEATTTFQQAIALDPNHPQPYVNLARVLINLNNLEGAASIVERALQIDPDFNSAKNNLELLTGKQKKQ